MDRKTGRLLKLARIKADITQGELAKKLGYKSPQMVSNWERGACGLPPKKALMFCRITGMSREVVEHMIVSAVTGKMLGKVRTQQRNSEE